jgi:hypothetical protein
VTRQIECEIFGSGRANDAILRLLESFPRE